MSELAILVAIGVPITLLLVVMIFVGRRQQKQALRRSQARFVRQKAEDLTDAVEFFMSVDNHRELQMAYMNRIVHLYAMYLQMLPKKDSKNQSVAFNKESFEQKILQERPVRQVFRSDQEIYEARKQFSILLKALAPMSKQLKFGAKTQEGYRRYLRTVLLEREVNSLIGLSDISVQKQNKSAASEYLKLAKQRIMMIDFKYDAKPTMIKEINDKMTDMYRGDAPAPKQLERQLEESENDGFDEAGFPLDPNADKQRF